MHNVAGEIKGAEAAMRYAVENSLERITFIMTMKVFQNGV